MDVQLADALGLPGHAVSAGNQWRAPSPRTTMLEPLQTVAGGLARRDQRGPRTSRCPHPRHEGHPRRWQEAVLRERRFRCGGRGRRRSWRPKRRKAERKMEMLDASVDGDLENSRPPPQSGPVGKGDGRRKHALSLKASAAARPVRRRRMA